MRLISRFALVSLFIISACSSIGYRAENDPNLWLEEIEGEKALTWVDKQNKRTLGEMTASKRYQTMNKQALSILQAKDKIPYVRMQGPYVYNFWQDDKHTRGLWRRTSLKSYKNSKKPRWVTVLDVDKLAKTEKENWVFKGSNCLEPEGRYCLLTLSRGGKDASVLREFDTKTKKFVKGGFQIPEAKSWVDWKDKDTLFVATNFGQGTLTDSGYPKLVKVLKRGQKLSEAKLLYEGQKTDMAMGPRVMHFGDQSINTLMRMITFYTSELIIERNGKLKTLPLQESAKVWAYVGHSFVVELRKDWKVGSTTYSKGTLLGVKTSIIDQGKVKPADVTPLFTPTAKTSVLTVGVTQESLLINTLDTVKGKILKTPISKTGFGKAVVLNLMQNAHLTLGDTSSYKKEFFFNYEGFLNPDAYYIYSKGKAKKLRALPAKFNSDGMTVEQRWATSKDGTKVPYFLVGKKSVIKKGQAPTLLYGYGGFEVSLTPRYKAVVGKLWLEKGGLYVMANIRGGGEFGPQWHQAALKTNRQKAYDDFISVGEDLVKTGVTVKEKLAIQGGSNGGLLVGAVMTQRPDLFKAVLCHVPLLDMLRYSQLLAGASWMAEYGNPEDPKMAEYLAGYSPYHNVSADKKYPELFLLTSTKDDRVHPGHARKMAAKMMNLGHKNILYYENTEGGHAATANLKQKARMRALTYEFLYKNIY